MTNLFVGIDISMKDFKVQLMNDTGETVAKRRRFLNDQPGLDSLVELILTTCQTNNIDRVVIGLESTSVYSWHLQMGLAGDEIVARPLEDLIDFLMEKGNKHFTDPNATAKALKKAAHNAHRLKGGLLEPVNLILATSIETIRCLEKQIKVIDKAIANEISHFKNTLDSVPGLGPVSCAGLIAEIGDIRRFPNDSALAKYAGLTWRGRQSGEFEADETPLTKTGNAYLRYYFVQAANQVRQHEPEYRQFYARKYRESKTHHHRRALVLTARKLVRMVDALLRSNQLYKPQGQRSDSA